MEIIEIHTEGGPQIKYGYITGVAGIMLDQRNPEVKGHHKARWMLTHIPTGKKFPHWFGKKKTALYVARQLGRLADWSKTVEEIKAEYPWKRVKEIALFLCHLNRGL